MCLMECAMSKSIETSKTLCASLLEDHWNPKLMRKLIEVDMKLTYLGARVSKPKVAKIIVDFVKKSQLKLFAHLMSCKYFTKK